LNAASEAERKKLEQRLSLKLAEAEKTIAATRQSAMSNVRGIAADAASAIVQRLTGVVPDGKSVDSAVDASLKG
jgi:F-type H+-transporting ATPase subunit b